MALPAKLALNRLGGTAGIRRDHVLLRRLVALSARQQSVGRDGLGPGNLAMTPPTILGRSGRFGRVRVVAADTGLGCIVRRGIDLRKPRGPCRVVGMAQKAIRALPRDL